VSEAAEVAGVAPGRAGQSILTGGLVAGALDITAACTLYWFRGVSPVRILQSVASGLLGADAFTGGARTACLGLLLHFVIAFGATTVYVAASRKLSFLVRRPRIAGALYGVAVYIFMHFAVLPLSAVAKRPFDPGLAAIIVLIHIVCVGLPIAWAVSRNAAIAEGAG
jgi:hypothetical protein